MGNPLKVHSEAFNGSQTFGILTYFCNFMNFKDKLQQRWGLKSGWHVLWILVIFAITGFSIIFVKDRVFDFLGYHNIENNFMKILAYIGIMYPLYQILLILVGSICGQYHFFSGFIIKMNTRFIKPFKKRVL
jgi:hypothetical protein